MLAIKSSKVSEELNASEILALSTQYYKFFSKLQLSIIAIIPSINNEIISARKEDEFKFLMAIIKYFVLKIIKNQQFWLKGPTAFNYF